MSRFFTHTHYLNDLPLYSIDLEPEDFDSGRAISQLPINESGQWQAYLNAIALFSFRRWLEAQLPDRSVQQDTHAIESMGQLEVHGFKLGLIAAEHILDEKVYIPRRAIEQVQSHFYVLLEVLEEEERSLIKGFLRHDHLVEALNHLPQNPSESEVYALPFSMLNAEVNHLLAYCRYLAPSASFSSSMSDRNSQAIADTVEPIVNFGQTSRTKLSQWLEGILDEGWQLIETLISPDAALAFNTRSSATGTKRGKLIDLGIQLGEQKVALLIIITPEVEDKLATVIQIHPTGSAKALPSCFKLSLVSKTGQILRQVESRQNDSYIQLPILRGKIGTQFSVQLSLNTLTLLEEFEL
ncbi:MAG: DUF1822 family protein [Oscillatoriophycideae cyanobacterium NC_groundwater_1537_Pr4_S-0.65um_50_18]|nr:DUF1822 family protein [Oscillatoriophycideae cyanobacterium NC_groundwater_1537_Pr4_S-0.65um_50_18]